MASTGVEHRDSALEQQPLLRHHRKARLPALNLQHWQSHPFKGDQWSVRTTREATAQFLSSKAGHYSVLTLVSLDVLSMIADFVLNLFKCEQGRKGSDWDLALEILGSIALVFSCLFMLELIASVWAFGWKYFNSWFHCFDAFIVIAGFITDVALRGIIEEVASLIVVMRLWRVIKIIEEISLGAQEQNEKLNEMLAEFPRNRIMNHFTCRATWRGILGFPFWPLREILPAEWIAEPIYEMVVVKRFRSVWGIESGDGFKNWISWFPDLKNQGYAGVEIDITDRDAESLRQLRRKLDDAGLEATVLIHTAWAGYVGARPKDLTPDVHLDIYRQNLERAKILKPVKINAQSGGDYWSLDDSVYFYQKTLEIDKELGLTGFVTHIHARIGTTQSSQCPEPEHSIFKEEREFFERFWLRVVQARSQDSDVITFVPEYGSHGEVADSEGKRLQELFEDSL
ncbi:unnamed protein product [Fusarium equiseti]|uniref:Ion transport domain-containing protein n=1 Tax=Fusarium equiseti TaxID=61235 RepID=A0A8J2J4C5_FUSEQ|nr:unnamed protein product [Fusarium equiseti]